MKHVENLFRRQRRPRASQPIAVETGLEVGSQSGVVLLVTLVVLMVLALLAYTVTSRVASHRHRVQYLINRAKARYALDSALKYATVAVEGLDLTLVSRPNEPDFSNLFAMTDEQIAAMVDKVNGISRDRTSASRAAAQKEPNRLAGARRDLEANEPDLAGLASEEPLVRGPYGPRWPLVTEPIEFEIGTAKIRIEIEDENAKYPLGWLLFEDPTVQRAAGAGFDTLCEWMGWTADDISTLKGQVAQVGEIRSFKMPADQPGAGAAAATAARNSVANQAAAAGAKGSSTATGRAGAASQTAASAAARQAAARAVPRRADIRAPMSAAEKQTADLVSLVHSSLLDRDFLSRPTSVSDTRKESLSKYIGLWGATQVNINTAPRHVLEAALAFGGDAARNAEAIIRQRQIQPIKDVGELRKTVTRYADSLEKGSKYLTCASTVLTIRITAVSGAARVSAVVGVVKDGKTVKTLGVISG
jgi:hypothetical protein